MLCWTSKSEKMTFQKKHCELKKNESSEETVKDEYFSSYGLYYIFSDREDSRNA